MPNIHANLPICLTLLLITGQLQAACDPPGPPCITNVQSLTLPDITKPGGSEPTTSIAIICNNSGAVTAATYGNSGNPFADGISSSISVQGGSANTVYGTNTTGICAEFTVYSNVGGDAGRSYSYSFNSNSALPTGISISSGYTCRSKSHNSTSCGTLDGSAQDTIYCYGGVSVSNSAGTGPYSGADLQVTVSGFAGSCP